jgi:hypothetical protein
MPSVRLTEAQVRERLAARVVRLQTSRRLAGLAGVQSELPYDPEMAMDALVALEHVRAVLEVGGDPSWMVGQIKEVLDGR